MTAATAFAHRGSRMMASVAAIYLAPEGGRHHGGRRHVLEAEADRPADPRGEHANLESARFDGNGGWDSVTVHAGPKLTFPDVQQLQSLTITGTATVGFTLDAGVSITRENLRVAENATLILSIHRELDALRSAA